MFQNRDKLASVLRIDSDDGVSRSKVSKYPDQSENERYILSDTYFVCVVLMMWSVRTEGRG